MSTQFGITTSMIFSLIVGGFNLAVNGLIGSERFDEIYWLNFGSMTFLTSASIMKTQWEDISPTEFCNMKITNDVFVSENCTTASGIQLKSG